MSEREWMCISQKQWMTDAWHTNMNNNSSKGITAQRQHDHRLKQIACTLFAATNMYIVIRNEIFHLCAFFFFATMFLLPGRCNIGKWVRRRYYCCCCAIDDPLLLHIWCLYSHFFSSLVPLIDCHGSELHAYCLVTPLQYITLRFRTVRISRSSWAIAKMATMMNR